MKKLLFMFVIASAVFIAGCKKDNYQEKVGVCPLVVSTIPIDKAVNVPLNQVISATFNEKMDPETITGTSFTVQQGATIVSAIKSAMVETPVAGTVTYSGLTASFTPSSLLAPGTTYTGRVTKSAKDLFGQSLQADYVWTFTTIPQITLSSNPAGSGSLTGAGTFDVGSTVTVLATPNPGYAFLNWTENGAVISTNSTHQFTMSGNRTLVANFTLQYTVNLTANPILGGITVGSGAYNAGSSVTVTATPNAEFNFTNWTDNGTIVSTNSTYTFPLNANKSLVANFALKTYSLNVTTVNGTAVRIPNLTIFNSGTTVELTATPNAGYTFTSWSGDATGNTNPLTVTMNSTKNITANFAINTYLLNVTAINGMVEKNPNQLKYNSGTTVELTATPNAGYTFTSWSGDATGNTNPLTVTMNSTKNITANFTAIASTFTLNATGVNGTVLKAPNLATYNSGATVLLTATPNLGYVFSSWSGDANGSANPLTVTMNANKNITANFTLIPINTFVLNVTTFNGTVLNNPDLVSYNSGATVQLTATANSGYTFSSWSGDANGSLNPLTVTMNSDKNITANFIEDVIIPVGPVVNLNTAGDFSILTKSGISSTGITSVQGNIGVSPAAAAAITGFGLIMDTNGESSHTSIATHVTGKVYASDYAPPTPSKLTVAVSDMETAYTTANNLVTPAPVLEQGAGNLSGLTLAPGLYKWSTGVLISPDASVTLSGGANDTWVFQIAQDLTLLSSAKVNLIGGAQAKNITWVVAGQAVLGTNTVLYGTILSKTLISLNTGSKVTGKLMAQTAVTLNASTVVAP